MEEYSAWTLTSMILNYFDVFLDRHVSSSVSGTCLDGKNTMIFHIVLTAAQIYLGHVLLG